MMEPLEQKSIEERALAEFLLPIQVYQEDRQKEVDHERVSIAVAEAEIELKAKIEAIQSAGDELYRCLEQGRDSRKHYEEAMKALKSWQYLQSKK